MENSETHLKLVIDNCIGYNIPVIKSHIIRNINTVLFAIEQYEFYKFNITSRNEYKVFRSYDNDGTGYDTLRVTQSNLGSETVFIKKPRMHNEISDSNLSTRLKNCLLSAGFTSFSEIKNLRNLYRIRNFGDNCLIELVEYMNNPINGLQPKKDIRIVSEDKRTISEEELRAKYEGKASICPRLWYKRRGILEPEWSKQCNKMRKLLLKGEEIQEKGFTNQA